MADGRLLTSTIIAVGVGDWLVDVAELRRVGGESSCCEGNGATAAESSVGGGGDSVVEGGAQADKTSRNKN